MHSRCALVCQLSTNNELPPSSIFTACFTAESAVAGFSKRFSDVVSER